MSNQVEIKVGKSYRIDYGPGNPSNKTVHVLAIVDGRYVFKWWSRGKRTWMYEVEPHYFFSSLDHYANLKQS